MTTSPETQQVWDMLGEHAVCMLVTRTRAGMRARPMVALPDRKSSLIWFIAGTEGEKDEEIEADSDVCITYARPSGNDFLSISGTAAMAHDRDKLKELWNDGAQTYFPNGPDSADVALIMVTPNTGEYWDAVGNKALIALEMIQSRFAGERPDIGDNAKVAF